jgi:membrane-associated phospholipid phosphatase
MSPRRGARANVPGAALRRAVGRGAVLAFAVLAIGTGMSRAGESDDAGRAAEAPLDWRQIGRDARYVFGRPAHLDGRGWARLGAGVGSGVLLYGAREDAREIVERNRSTTLDDTLQTVHAMGKLAAVPATALGFYIVGKARRSAYDRETALMLIESLSFSAAIAGAGQLTLATDRPRDGDRVRFFRRNGHGVSGDVTIAASMLAPVVDRHLHAGPGDTAGVRLWKRVGSGALYAAAGLVAWQRMYNERHWLPDVYFGYLNGLSVGRMVVDAHRGGRAWRERPRRVSVLAGPGGLTIRWGGDPAPAP